MDIMGILWHFAWVGVGLVLRVQAQVINRSIEFYSRVSFLKYIPKGQTKQKNHTKHLDAIRCLPICTSYVLTQLSTRE